MLNPILMKMKIDISLRIQLSEHSTSRWGGYIRIDGWYASLNLTRENIRQFSMVEFYTQRSSADVLLEPLMDRTICVAVIYLYMASHKLS